MKSNLWGAVSACVFTLGLVTTASSGQITQLVIQDVGSTVGGTYNSVPDGNSGGFGFVPIDPETYALLTGFSTDTGIPMLWGTAATPLFQGPSAFTSGFLFAGLPVEPFTFGTRAVALLTHVEPVPGRALALLAGFGALAPVIPVPANRLPAVPGMVLVHALA